jgi:hypothetical protein
MFYVRVAEVHTTIATDYVRVERMCACGTLSHANVLVQTEGVAEAPFYVGTAEASERATSRAVRALPAAARRSVGLARCPACHRRDRGCSTIAIIAEAIVPMIASILVFLASWFAAVMIGVGAGAKSGDRSAEVAILASPIAFTVLVLFLWTWLRWRKRTRWIDTVAVEFVPQH